MHNYIWYTYYLPSFMKFCSVVSDGQDKNNMSPHKSGGRHNKIPETNKNIILHIITGYDIHQTPKINLDLYFIPLYVAIKF